MNESTIIVFEKRPRWTPELQRQFFAENVRVQGCHAISRLTPLLEERSASLLIVDLDGAASECFQWLDRFSKSRFRRSVQLPVAVLGSGRQADLEWPIRELGVDSFLIDCHSGDELAHWCRRQWQNGPSPVRNGSGTHRAVRRDATGSPGT